ncbi:MAG: hypothetical protein KTU85_06665 [Acidimicrobiia bacterium]|nr:hypothetical protein [Acidimicrobiia bacterium]MCY4458381.1 hypothetical protein [Acidimicrobiaceae bacterium]
MDRAVADVLSVLEGAEFQRRTPLKIGGTEFKFDAAVVGTRVLHDLVVVSGPDGRPSRLAQLLSALNRTLDRLQSRRPVSLVIVGPRPNQSDLARLEHHARVLVVEHDAPTTEQIKRAIAVLLPLEIPKTAAEPIAPLTELTSTLGSKYSVEHETFINAARSGPDAVRESLRLYVDGAVDVVESEGP